MSLVTFHDLLAERLPQAAQRTALIERDERLTYEELARQSDALAAQLTELGVTSGDRVAVHLKPYIPQAIASFAAARVGAAFVNIHYQWTTEQLLHVVGDSGARALITDARVGTALAARTVPPTLESTILHGGGEHLPGTMPWGAGAAELPAGRGADGDLAAILYTSGSTGPPKGVMLSHANIIAGARSVAAYLDNAADDRLIGVLPLCFDYGLNQLTTMMLWWRRGRRPDGGNGVGDRQDNRRTQRNRVCRRPADLRRRGPLSRGRADAAGITALCNELGRGNTESRAREKCPQVFGTPASC